MKSLFTLFVSTVLFCAAAPSTDPKAPRPGEFQRVVVKDVPAIFTLTPISPPKSKASITVFFQGDVIRPGQHEIPLASTVATLFRAQQGPGFLICGIDRLSVLRQEGEEIVVYTARGSELTSQLFHFAQGDHIFYHVTGY